jgi:hypothetical protein
MKNFSTFVCAGLSIFSALQCPAFAQLTPTQQQEVKGKLPPPVKFNDLKYPEPLKEINAPVLTIEPVDPKKYECKTEGGWTGLRYLIDRLT